MAKYSIQLHFSRTRHYDLRLEIDNVLKSWAIPKTPPIKIGEKRLAVETEDHSLDYWNFEGIIEEGQYGAGKVEVWDIGSHKIQEISENKILTKINGKKLKGVYCLIHFRPKEKNWLFFKRKS